MVYQIWPWLGSKAAPLGDLNTEWQHDGGSKSLCGNRSRHAGNLTRSGGPAEPTARSTSKLDPVNIKEVTP
jgi:hypothetical protein